MTKKIGFTLAEVLITLGIIGVVAALTIPSLVQNYKKKEATTRLKKFYSVFAQAILLSENVNGDSAGWSNPSYNNEGTQQANDENYEMTLTFFNTYLKPYIKYTSISRVAGSKIVTVRLPDGVTVNLTKGTCIDIYVDINGDRKPNKTGRDKFVFLICNPTILGNENHCGRKVWCTYEKERLNTREKALARCKTEVAACSTLLHYDDWEFKDDYPYKL